MRSRSITPDQELRVLSRIWMLETSKKSLGLYNRHSRKGSFKISALPRISRASNVEEATSEAQYMNAKYAASTTVLLAA